MTNQLPILYSFRRCPWAMRARMALTYASQQCEIREVNLREKPAAMLAVSSKATVPILILPNGKVIDESYDIMLWAIQQSDPDNWGAAIDHLLLHEPLQNLLKHIRIFKYQENSEHWQEAKQACANWLENLNVILQAQGFLIGKQSRLADAALFPIIRQVSKVDNEWFASLRLIAVENWLNYFYQADFFNMAMQKFPVWQGSAPKEYFLF